MIFVTVGACDLPFNRLVNKMDELVNNHKISAEIFMQIGHSTVPNADIPYKRFLSFEKMNEKADTADVIVTHGGPGSIMLALAKGKIPIVVPRQKQFGEMVDDHQIFFTRRLQEKKKILVVYDVDDLYNVIRNYPNLIKQCIITAETTKLKASLFATKIESVIFERLIKADERNVSP